MWETDTAPLSEDDQGASTQANAMGDFSAMPNETGQKRTAERQHNAD